MTTLHDLIPTKLAAGVWDSLMKYKKSIPNFPQTETCELLIIDRTIDQIAPLIHEWTYDAMCHDLLNMEGNKYVHEIPGKNGGQPERKEVLLEDHDPIWLELRYAHIADAEIIFLGQLRHHHLVKLIGYCCEDEHRLLVYEYMPRGSLESQLFRRYSAAMPWSTRMKIALGAAKGLAFLHEADKPVIYRDFKASNILLDSDYTAKLSDFGLAKDGPEGEETHVTTRVMGTHGYAAPEYIMTGHLTTKSDVYSYGVVLLELLTGRRVVDKWLESKRGKSLVEWARPMLRDEKKLERIIDRRLEGQFPMKGALKVAMLAFKCLSHHPNPRPCMSDVVKILEPLQDFDDVFVGPFVYVAVSENGDKD